jgi:Transposase DDE domain group 1
MKNNRKHTDESVPQSVTGFIKLQTAGEAIQIGFTDQKVSPHAGLATFAGFLHWHRFGELLGKLLPHRPKSNYALKPVDIALGYVAAMLAGARKLAHVAHLRTDPALPPLLRIKRVASQSTLSRFFACFNGAAMNLRTFDPLWRWCVERLSSRPGGYTLDLDTTQLLHEDAHQCEGVHRAHAQRL